MAQCVTCSGQIQREFSVGAQSQGSRSLLQSLRSDKQDHSHL